MANTFNFGSKKWATKEGSILAYNSENNNFKPLPFDFTRSSSATRVNKDGLIEVVGSDEPRVDYLNNADGHLLLEPQRTNSLPYSEDFSSWQTSNFGTLTGGQTGFDGSNNAWLYEYTGNAAIVQQSNTSSGVQTFSIFAKGNVQNGIRLYAFGTSNANTYFDLNLGIVENTSGTISNSIEDYGDGWYKCSMTFDQTNSNIYLYLTNNQNGLATSGSVYIQYAQLENGSYATSYIPTSGSSVTRAAEITDAISAPNGIIGQTEGTLYIDADCFLSGATGGARKAFIHLNDGTYNNRIEITKSGGSNIAIANDIRVRLSAGGVTAFDEVVAEDFEGKLKIAFAYESGNTAVYINGSSVYVNNSAITIPSTDEIQIGGTYGIATEEPITDARIYNTRLTNAQLIALTS